MSSDTTDNSETTDNAASKAVDAASAAALESMQSFDEQNNSLFRRRKAALLAMDNPDATRLEKRRAKREYDDATADIYRLNQGLLQTIVNKFTRATTADLTEEYHSAAAVGMVRAVETYDPDLGRFSSWCWKPIQREVIRAVRQNEFALSPSDFDNRPRVIKAAAAMADELGRRPEFDEVAERTGVSEDSVRRILNHRAIKSLNDPLGDEGDSEMADSLVDLRPDAEAQVEAAIILAAVEKYAFTVLTEQERMVIVRRYGLDGEPEQNLSAIGDVIGRSREAVRQIESRAIAKVLHPLVARNIMRHGRK